MMIKGIGIGINVIQINLVFISREDWMEVFP